MSNIYLQGSVWRKWDLHVHTPASIYQNYGKDDAATWGKFLKDIESLPKDFAVLGINDYYFIDGYERLKKEKEINNRISNITRIFPVVEFRIDKFAGVDFGKLKRINLHVVFSDEIPTETIRSQFLNTLDQSYYLETGEKWTRAITKESITELGKQIKSSVPATQLGKFGNDQIEGFNNLNVKEEQIFSSLDKDCFKGKFLIAVGKTEWADLKWTDASIATKKSIINQADLVFTAAASIEEYIKAKNQLKMQAVNDLLLDCSDAHYFSSATDKDRIGNCFTWIKADPTFEGLKQILYEPSRIYVGDTAPSLKDINRVISSVQILNSNGWFEEQEILLNPDLSCIIGSKGSGKTALADVIGLAGGDIDDKISSGKSFIGKAIIELNGAKIILKWQGGDVDEFEIGTDNPDEVSKKIQYLSQGFVEKICTEDLEGEELVSEIERIIFENLDEADKINYTDFDSLRAAKTDGINKKKKALSNAILKLNDEVFSLQVLIDSLPEKKKKKEALEKERQGIEKQKQEIVYSSDEEKRIEEANDKIQQQRDGLIARIAGLRNKIQKVSNLKSKIELFKISVEEFNDSVRLELTNIEIETKLFDKFKVQLDPDIIPILDDKTKHFEGEIIKLQGDASAENPLANTLAYFDKQLEQIRNQSTLEKSKKEKLEALQKRLKQIEIELQKLNQDISDIENVKLVSIKEKKEKRLEQYNLFFDALKEEKAALEKLYAPIQSKLRGSETSEEQLLSFETNMELDSTKLGDSIMTVLNRKKKGKFLNIPDDKVYSAVKEVFFEVMNSGSSEERNKVLNSFIDSFNTSDYSLQEHLRDEYTIKEFYDAVFSTDAFGLRYSLNFGGISLDNLTPGTKGIALLILYLGINQNEYRPLLIDQPEENLDNRSVYKVLRDYFRNAKLRRQIIMVTHNPNLVVNTDAEQVIVANFDREKKNQEAKICYKSGSLENTKAFDISLPRILDQQGIREHTCEILEGGVVAFEERENKYRIR